MRFEIPRLRRWFALGAIAVSLAVAGVYIHRRRQAREALKHIPGKIGVNIQQTAEGFKVSKSEQGHTIFTIQAKRAVQFKQGGRAELHNVTITVYGRDSSRYDQIYGDDFSYDPQSGDVTAEGEVRIDLEANPEGLLRPDQSAPAEMRNPIHLLTRNLVFNQKTGDAYTEARVEMRIPQASGSATGMHYASKENVLRLDSRVDFALSGSGPTTLTAIGGEIRKVPRQVVLDEPHLRHGAGQMRAQKAVVFLREDNSVDHVLASGDVQADLGGESPTHARAAQAEFAVNEAQDGLSHAVFSGDVQVDSAGDRPAHTSAGRVVLDIAGKNRVSRIHAEGNVKLVELPPATGSSRASDSPQVEVTAPAMDFFLEKGRRLDRAATAGAGQIAILATTGDRTRTVVTASKFEAAFDDHSRLSSVHGAPEARIVSSTPGQPDRVSTSQTVDAIFRPTGGIDSITQQGSVAYADGERRAWAERARYVPGDEMLVLTGSPRITDKGLTTSARTVRMNHATGDAVAEGDVKSSYSDLREQPNGALLAAASPIHVTARTMTAHRTTAVATYSGDAHIWQDANAVQAPTLRFDRDHRSVVAEGDGQPVSTVLVQVDKTGSVTPVSITSGRLTYIDDQHRAHFEGGVRARGADVTITADHLDAFMVPRGQSRSNPPVQGQGQLDRIVAEGNVVIQEPARRAQGEELVYIAAEDKFVLTGGSPSIFDAEHGKTTGDSLTFYKRDDRVQVEGRDASPTVTQTRVAR
jgi:lipopolysaccharide export system protein LptA